ncbi:MAG: dipeptide epimerase [Candidatus Marinimicrobia bacterium]|nr:dipeptide epimerase [Candidatus Neomarinimicrobiota bacterium]MCF7828220.1 dipeptide epimerase [Candidatus Neomarinimicrobiota bacterium]MCF7879605.1 dipeptide epimerase [Candidatus Neomarinimicrobiota bacterium]
MEVSAAIYELIPTHRFGISRETSEFYNTLLVKITHNGITGYGEAFPSARYEQSAEKNLRVLQQIDFPEFSDLCDIFQPWILHEWLTDICEGVDSLISAMTSAYYDVFGQIFDTPVTSLAGSAGLEWPLSSFTIGIDNLETIRTKVAEAESYPLLKVKLGSDNDEQIMANVREMTDKLVRVDANEGWNKEEALEKIEWLETLNVEFVEQPLPAGNPDDVQWLREQSPLPIIADEDCRHIDDLPEILPAYDGINIKLVKCGGITAALRMCHTAKTFGKSVMLGCMVESSAGIAPAAAIGGFADYLDLDGNLLLSNDPFTGPRAKNGSFSELTAPGLGVTEQQYIAWETLYKS